MRVRLLRKFADRINGIDLTGVDVGDVMIVLPYEGALLIAEGWAEGWAERTPAVPGSLLTLQEIHAKPTSRG